MRVRLSARPGLLCAAAVIGVLYAPLLSGCVTSAGSPSAVPSTGGAATTYVPPAASVASPAAIDAAIPRLEPANCATVAGVAGRERTCYDLVVRADRDDPASGTVRVRVAVYRSPESDRKPDPIVLLSGGPGGSALDWGATAMTGAGWSDRDFIVLDQRGTGVSTPSLNCPEIEAVGIQELSTRPTEADGAPPTTEAAVRACRDRLIAAGIDLRDYHSAIVADDLQDLRGLLGYTAWNLYGVSYGSRLALTVLRDHPAGVRSVILDSPAPPSVDLEASLPPAIVASLSNVFAQCAASAACAAAHPKLESRFWALTEHLTTSPMRFMSTTPVGDLSIVVDGAGVIAVSSLAFYDREFLRDLPGKIERIERDPAVLWEVSGDATIVTDQAIAEGVELSTLCSEERPYTSIAAVREAVAGLRPSVRTFALARAAYVLELCKLWDVPTLPGENEAVTSAVPTLIVSGGLDAVTPPSFSETAAATLSRAQRFVIPNEVHHLLGSSDCAEKLMAGFLADPTAAVDGACVSAAGAVEFR
jgi:pimeloyl-ACP methyl ester carboxylesterase